MELTGHILDYLVVFWGGVLVSFTPCVYPVMPITASFIAGANTRGTPFHGFVISLVYVFGMAVTYCSLAAFAALTGKIFGQIQNTFAVQMLVGVLLVVFALIMFDVIPLPYFGLTAGQRVRPKNLWAVLLAGVTAGLVVGPCTAPALGTLLVYVASKQNILHGVSLMFVFSYGVGASLILIGTFSGLVSRLPQSGAWLIRIKQLTGLVLLMAAGYFMVHAWRYLR